jgi:cytochrome c oxidase subunit 3/cytochrome o ubiquinol oxidase subunit 3
MNEAAPEVMGLAHHGLPDAGSSGDALRHEPAEHATGWTAAQWGMAAFLVSEASLFSTLLVTYMTFWGQDKVGPTPREALSLPLALANTACLLASSAVIHVALKRIEAGKTREFLMFWAGVIVLGVLFLLGTAYEWRELIETHHLTISRNMFGTTYYTLVGFHALHVTIGVVTMIAVAALVSSGEITSSQRAGAELTAWYWHFVDAVWIAVFSVVYLIGR